MPALDPIRLGLQRSSLWVAAAVAPRLVDRLVVDWFATPRRRAPGGAPSLGEAWTIRSGGEDVAVHTSGSGPRVLFVHGWEGGASDFALMAAAFRVAGFGVVAFDHPAHGASTGRRTTLPAMARAVLDVARATGPFAAAVGHSLGGSAVLLALRDGLAARCAALVAPPYDARHFLTALAKQLGLSDARAAGAVAELRRRVGAVGGRETDRAAARILVPGLVLHDRDDRAVPFSHGVAVAAAWPGARLVPLDGVGHRRALDAPAVQQELLDFVRRAAGRPGRAPTIITTPRRAAAGEWTK